MQFDCLKRQILSPAKGRSIKIGGLTTQKPAGTVLTSCNSNWKPFAVGARERTVAVLSAVPVSSADVTYVARAEGGYTTWSVGEGGMRSLNYKAGSFFFHEKSWFSFFSILKNMLSSDAFS